MKHLVRRFSEGNSGATAMEYGLIAGGIALAIIAIVNALGGQLGDSFHSATAALEGGDLQTVGLVKDK